jgi:hypothetical protein
LYYGNPQQKEIMSKKGSTSMKGSTSSSANYPLNGFYAEMSEFSTETGKLTVVASWEGFPFDPLNRDESVRFVDTELANSAAEYLAALIYTSEYDAVEFAKFASFVENSDYKTQNEKVARFNVLHRISTEMRYEWLYSKKVRQSEECALVIYDKNKKTFYVAVGIIKKLLSRKPSDVCNFEFKKWMKQYDQAPNYNEGEVIPCAVMAIVPLNDKTKILLMF